jgi:hypothetical protein
MRAQSANDAAGILVRVDSRGGTVTHVSETNCYQMCGMARNASLLVLDSVLLAVSEAAA